MPDEMNASFNRSYSQLHKLGEVVVDHPKIRKSSPSALKCQWNALYQQNVHI